MSDASAARPPRDLTPVPAERFRQFVEYILCEARGRSGKNLVYWRGDLRQPIAFLETGMVPMKHITNCLSILGMTKAQYFVIMDRFYPPNDAPSQA